jgi:hypothetical protein
MAYGGELFLGMVGEEPTMQILASMGLSYERFEGLGIENTPLAAALKQAHREALEELGLKVHEASAVKRSDGRACDEGYVYVEGPDGKVRQTSIWDLEVDYDPDEMGHEKEDMLVGVSLISRYFPVFLDWDKDSGGSGDTISLTPDVLNKIEIARKHLSKVLPFIQDAPIVFRERHY